MTSTKELVKPTEKAKEEEEKSNFCHCFCIICNWNRDTIISLCGAFKRPKEGMTFHLRPMGEVCVVCDELSRRPCSGCCA